MSSRPLLLETSLAPDETPILKRKIERLESEIQDLHSELQTEKGKSASIARGVMDLRRQLTPLYNGLRAVFGELDELGVQDAPAAPQASAKWDFWKKRYPGRISETIDLLLVQGSMNTKELSAALKCDPRTLASSVIYKMNGAGLIVKNGNRFSLKEL